MNNKENKEKSQNEIKHELANAWSLYLWDSLDQQIEAALEE